MNLTLNDAPFTKIKINLSFKPLTTTIDYWKGLYITKTSLILCQKGQTKCLITSRWNNLKGISIWGDGCTFIVSRNSDGRVWSERIWCNCANYSARVCWRLAQSWIVRHCVSIASPQRDGTRSSNDGGDRKPGMSFRYPAKCFTAIFFSRGWH
jgi:hypothetical protein